MDAGSALLLYFPTLLFTDMKRTILFPLLLAIASAACGQNITLKLTVHRGPLEYDPYNNMAITTPAIPNADINSNGIMVKADAAGEYIDQLPAHWSGTIVPVYPDYTFDTLVITDLQNDTEHHFGSVFTGTYTVSGICLTRDGQPIAGATVYTATDTAYTDADGKYSFKIKAGWSGAFNISKPDYFFDMQPGGYVLNSLDKDIALPAFSGIERYVIISSPPLRQKLVNDPKINTDGDSYIQLREARAFTGLLDISGIILGNDMLELYAFANITSLYLNNARLQTVDFSRFAHLRAIVARSSMLVEMILSGNPDLQFINTINSLDLELVCGGPAKMTATVDAHTVVSATCNEAAKQDIVLEQGWNIISLNVDPDVCTGAKPCIKELFNGLDVAEIKSQDAFWRIGQPEMFNSLTRLEPGKGYLVYMNKAGTLTVSGTAAGISSVGTLRPGWNLVGSPYTYPVPFFDIIGNKFKEIKDFDDFYLFGSGGTVLIDMMPGKGYFVKK